MQSFEIGSRKRAYIGGLCKLQLRVDLMHQSRVPVKVMLAACEVQRIDRTFGLQLRREALLDLVVRLCLCVDYQAASPTALRPAAHDTGCWLLRKIYIHFCAAKQRK